MYKLTYCFYILTISSVKLSYLLLDFKIILVDHVTTCFKYVRSLIPAQSEKYAQKPNNNNFFIIYLSIYSSDIYSDIIL